MKAVCPHEGGQPEFTRTPISAPPEWYHSETEAADSNKKLPTIVELDLFRHETLLNQCNNLVGANVSW